MSIEAIPLNSAQSQRILQLYHLYRLVIGGVLAGLVASELDQELLKLAHAELFSYGSWLYLSLNLLLVAVLRHPHRLFQVFSLAVVDVLLLCCLFYAAGGTPSGIGNLIIVSVAISNILLRGRIGLLIAALASIGLIYLTFYLSLSHPAVSNQFLQAGALGALCFTAAIFVQRVTQRLQQSEVLAAERATEVANLEALNAQILQRMRTGILVLDQQERLLLSNPSANQLLGTEEMPGKPLSSWLPELGKRLQHWQHNPTLRAQSLQAYSNGPVLQTSFVNLPHGNQQHTLVFIEDISQITQQAQQLKLASLGRLTAGIAHEIRNPLGAISHAAQLLRESDALEPADQRLTQIIMDQSRRMNLVIENVLQLSRRRQAEPQLLDLKYWLQRFVSEFQSSAPAKQKVHLQTQTGTMNTRMDPHQLNQVLTNLVQNALRYSGQENPQSQVWLNLFRDPSSELPILEVSDDGPGVTTEHVQNIFEPFYTTENKGTGLGLYISRELCESNQARLDYKPGETGGSCFRITFAHPRKLS